jgi:MinD superfamily P-loop ATPase
VLAREAVLADCDVDAADLHLVLNPNILSQEDFSGGSRAEIRTEDCTGCGTCLKLCRFDAVIRDRSSFRIDAIACEGCGVCHHFCPEKAIEFIPAINGQWFVSETRFGPLVHARLGVAQENSGKLVTLIRSQAKQLAREQFRDLVIIDGSPGIGCPVIASLTGADLVLAVTEAQIRQQALVEYTSAGASEDTAGLAFRGGTARCRRDGQPFLIWTVPPDCRVSRSVHSSLILKGALS